MGRISHATAVILRGIAVFRFSLLSLTLLYVSTSASSREFVLEMPQPTVSRIQIRGNRALTERDLLSQFRTTPGSILDPGVLENDIREIIARYERIGYPFAQVRIDDIATVQGEASRGLRVILHVDEGEKVVVGEIRVRGNRETSEHVIIRESRISTPSLYDEDKISRIPQRLNRLNIFSSVREPELFVSSHGGGLLIGVEEGNTNTFDGILGYVPGATSDQGGYVTGIVNVAMRNLFGTARSLEIRWQRDDRSSQEIGIEYVEPWIFDIPINVSGSFFQRQQDSVYVRRVVGLNSELMFSDILSVKGSLEQDNIIPSTSVSLQPVSESRTLTAGVGIRYDSRDDLFNPTGGIDYTSDYHFGSKRNSGSGVSGKAGRSTVQRISMDAEIFLSPAAQHVVAVGVHGRQLTSDDIELGDYYRFGGTTTLRGYRENQFLGSRVAWTNTEYRLLLARRSYVYGLFDTGYYFLPSDELHGTPSAQGFKFGYGVGVQLETSLGNMGVSIAMGQGDSFSQAKLHIRLINRF